MKEDRVRALFAAQPFMHTLRAVVTRIHDGEVELTAPCSAELSQQTGAMHAGAIAALMDTACALAAATRARDDRTVVSVEFKLNLLAPAVGDEVRAVGRVVRAGRTLTVCSGDLWARTGGHDVHVAVMQATMMAVSAPPGPLSA